jgi:hypothetical protein
MRAVNLAKVAAEAEILRIRHMLKRQGMRAAFGLAALIFALGVLVLAHVAGWQVLRLYVPPIYATLILLVVDLMVAAIFGILAARSSPSHDEREALTIKTTGFAWGSEFAGPGCSHPSCRHSSSISARRPSEGTFLAAAQIARRQRIKRLGRTGLVNGR